MKFEQQGIVQRALAVKAALNFGLKSDDVFGEPRGKLAVAQDASCCFNEAGGSIRACVSRRV